MSIVPKEILFCAEDVMRSALDSAAKGMTTGIGYIAGISVRVCPVLEQMGINYVVVGADGFPLYIEYKQKENL